MSDITLQGWNSRDDGGLNLQRHFRHVSQAEQTRVPIENVILIGGLTASETAQWCAHGTLPVP